ncbi:MAG: type IV pilus secretin PilQ [Bdellovibrionota bacterium]
MKKNNKKHLINKSLIVVLLSLNMLACSTVQKEDAVKVQTSQDRYNKNISQAIENAVNRAVLGNEKVLSHTLNIKTMHYNDVEKYHIGTKNPNSSYSANVMQSPLRLVLDLKGEGKGRNQNFSINSKYVSSLRLGAHPDKARFVFDLNSSNLNNVSYDVVKNNQGFDVFISDNKTKIANVLNTTKLNTTKEASKVDKINEESSDLNSAILAKINEDKKGIMEANKLAEKQVSEKENQKLANLANSEIKMREAKIKEAKLKNDKIKLNKQYVVSKIQCQEKANRLQVNVNVDSNVTFDLEKNSDSEYSLRLKNTILAKEADKPIALPKTYSSLNSIQANKSDNDTVIKLYVNKDTELNATRTNLGVLISENYNAQNNAKNNIKNDIKKSAKEIKETHKIVADKDVLGGKLKNNDSLKATIQKADATTAKENIKAQMDLSKLKEKFNMESSNKAINDTNENVNDDAKEKNLGEEINSGLGGTIEIDDISQEYSDDKKGLGNEDEMIKEDFEGIDEEIVKLLDPASGYTGKLISLDFQDTDIGNALKIIAEVSNLNIVASDDITGKVSLRLNNVPWDQALDVILKTNGLDKVQEGNVVRIAPVNKLKSEREELKAARQAEENLEPLQLAYRKVSYAKAAELQALVESVLSDRGSVTFDDRSNQIFIKDIKPRIKDAFEIIKKADLRTPQILLETQIIEAERNLVRELGSEFGFTLIQSELTGNATGYNFPSTVAVGGSNGGNFSSFPAAISEVGGSAVSLIFDSLDGSKSLQARISGLENEGRLKIVSKPSVVTTNNTPAEIKSVETVSIRLPDGGTSIATGQGSSASGVSKSATESIDAGITLKVTPQASPDYYVLLDIMGESSHFGSRAVDGIPSIVIRRATSTVLVSSGQTFALGGIYKVTDKDTLAGVPFLKDIPVLGHFFRKSSVDNSDEELLFFVTPRIVEGSFDDAK